MVSPDLIYDTLIAPNFAESRRDTRGRFTEDCTAGRLRMTTSVRDGEYIGVAITRGFADATLLSYLAVRSDMRSTGVGAELLRKCVLESSPPILAEVERPDSYECHPVHGDPDRRLAFYAEHGGHVIDIPFFQRSVSPGRSRRHGTMLMRIDPAEGGWMPSESLRGFVGEYFGESDDLEVVTLRAALSVPTVKLLRPSDYAHVYTP